MTRALTFIFEIFEEVELTDVCTKWLICFYYQFFFQGDLLADTLLELNIEHCCRNFHLRSIRNIREKISCSLFCRDESISDSSTLISKHT